MLQDTLPLVRQAVEQGMATLQYHHHDADMLAMLERLSIRHDHTATVIEADALSSFVEEDRRREGTDEVVHEGIAGTTVEGGAVQRGDGSYRVEKIDCDDMMMMVPSDQYHDTNTEMDINEWMD